MACLCRTLGAKRMVLPRISRTFSEAVRQIGQGCPGAVSCERHLQGDIGPQGSCRGNPCLLSDARSGSAEFLIAERPDGEAGTRRRLMTIRGRWREGDRRMRRGMQGRRRRAVSQRGPGAERKRRAEAKAESSIPLSRADGDLAARRPGERKKKRGHGIFRNPCFF